MTITDNVIKTLIEPDFYRYISRDSKTKPSAVETLQDLYNAINFTRDRRHIPVALFFFFNVGIGLIFVIHLACYATLASIIFMSLSTCFLGTIFNTVWYHRYCSHRAFKFCGRWPTTVFLWTNPLLFREECYAIPHKIHHRLTEQFGDPYGPHLGWLASFLSSELTQRINTEISEQEFDRLKRSIRHIGLAENSFADFKRTGSIDGIAHYIARTTLAQGLWASLAYSVGGIAILTAWYGSIFVILLLIRDFNWRGHGGNKPRPEITGGEFNNRSYALNQHFYGYLASEWHDNHHRYPLSANNAFTSGQFDLAFQIIKFLSLIGLVESYIDTRHEFARQCATSNKST